MNKKICMSEFSDIRYDARVLKQAGTLTNYGFDVTLIMYNSDIDQLKKETYNNFSKISIPFKKRYNTKNTSNKFIRIFQFFKIFFIYFKTIISCKADLYHGHNFTIGWMIYISSLIHKGKFIYDLHELNFDEDSFYFKEGVRIDKFLLNKASFTICPSNARSEIIIDIFKLKKPPVILSNYPSIINLPKNENDNVIRRELKINDNSIILFYSGMLSVKTRLQDNIIKAIPNIKGDVVFVILGFGHPSEIDYLKNLIDLNNLKNKVVILPPKSHNVLLEYTSCADIGISLLKQNKLSHKFHALNKFYEYIASGLAILSSNSPQFQKDIFENPVGEIGLTCNEEDINDIADKISLLIADKNKLQQMKMNSKKLFEDFWNWEKQESKLLEAYNKIDV